ncbi:Gfo/Idh/MocA family oxidoreductase (plasmid) [Deinococcus metallilatus]|uniref:Dehydrogenase n=1 Tax=Deinococcus metallilatus TaxID=1211322 RepID=A0AAJ5K1L3_9DEIO|nr:Gfo/Idh/MocA family oxidoreductase [Deinococcus metallilatus]MBB5293523.1 putative dehydrogenase [Deinococcus metallilatus]QBY06599.1 Gfo/Idh/MocA family oxidoreductase [Deinococcus metallilatus]RXJ17942.1 Gfo/Idh/MocA family oxidoreductase [Deinococcus metallilatus]TLK32213.1 Gfo/Idh/MocA family oxidoreductase [Deinococcus metallilatus]GMA15257.1 oxidoreductase [Deinococcus metallilatus]
MTVPQPDPVRLIVVGAGNRGHAYAKYALQHPQDVRIVGVAEPREFQRTQLAAEHGLPPERVWSDWRELLRHPRLADGVIIATQDEQHVEPAVALSGLGYHLLLEKPMAPSAAECVQIVDAVKAAGVMLAVCHVLRYTPYTQALQRVLRSGRIGQIVSVEHLEPVGHTHQAHSFVRGNWRNEEESSFMLLAKSCHDLDWLSYVMGEPCEAVSSFGGLLHFRRENQPPGASDRCLTCPPEVEESCPYSAPRYYLGLVEQGKTGWPVEVITNDPTREGVLRALETGPYGRCVYACDNDVVDHQVVNLRFRSGATASFTMTAFNRGRGRETRIFGTRGEIYGDSRCIHVFDFLTGQTEVIDTQVASDGAITSGHGGGDDGIMAAFVRALATNDPSHILSGPDATLESHLITFRAEEARRKDAVLRMETR